MRSRDPMYWVSVLIGIAFLVFLIVIILRVLGRL